MYVECEQGLFCDYTDTNMGVCKEYIDYGEGADGDWVGHD